MSLSSRLKITLAAAGAALALLGGVAGFAIARGTDDGAASMSSTEAPAQADGGGGMPGMDMSGGMDSGGADATMDESAFLAAMIPHHESAVEMASIVIRRGSDPQVRALARRIVADQRGEIDQMRAWYREWFGGDPPSTSMSDAMGMMGMDMDPADLETADEPDRRFLSMMIAHHASAIMMADMVLAGNPRAEVADLARRIIAAQAAEIGEMQAMRERIAPPLG